MKIIGYVTKPCLTYEGKPGYAIILITDVVNVRPMRVTDESRDKIEYVWRCARKDEYLAWHWSNAVQLPPYPRNQALYIFFRFGLNHEYSTFNALSYAHKIGYRGF